jgi:hypothetical protein
MIPTLRVRGVSAASAGPVQSEFRFIVGSASYSCPILLAQLISPVISRLRFSDCSLNTFVIQTPDPSGSFPDVLALARSEPINVTEVNRDFLLSVFEELGNSDFYFRIRDYFEGGPNLSTFVDRLHLHDSLGSPCESEPAFAAAQFGELPTSVLSSLTVPDLYEIFSQSTLKIRDEEWLYDFIFEHSDTDDQYLSLLDFVRFQFLSTDRISHFSERLIDIIQFLTPWTLRALGDRLALPVTILTENPHEADLGIRFPYSPDKPVSGIIAYLNSQCEGNLHDKEIIELTASTMEMVDTRPCHPKYITILTSASRFGTKNRPPSWFKCDFKGMRITPTHYTIVTDHDDPGWRANHPISWVLQGSLDDAEWKELDRQQDCQQLNGPDRTVTFEITTPTKFRYLRFQLTGPNSKGESNLEMRYFELFGKLYRG